ncbi:FtsX-like permease family protein [Actinacidiphila paucisporea]|uniref:Putative ABC transport system permease protein n=1 Tax=Actinacidiphila paucisporea TaxID=310782 RepID=A0A1M7C0K8_9ACTN|nr:ABC transporter permease [Actinacidiphila paucisporea]SHL60379.1 putative ABC transport system permease protein [Actinacidiphila paucisporea]
MTGRAQAGVPGVGRLHTWRAAIRIARRDAMRFKGRSLLVLAMIALPIMGVSAVDVTIRSSQLTTAETATRELGAADARISDAGHGPQPVYQEAVPGGVVPVQQNPGGKAAAKEVTVTEPDGSVAVAGEITPPVDPLVALPAGAHRLSDAFIYAPVRTRFGLLNVEIRELKAADPIAAGIAELDRGRFPAAADEMAATNGFLKSSGLHVGSQVRVRGLDRSYRIVGAYDLPSQLDAEQLNALPGAFIPPYEATRSTAERAMDPSGVPTYLVSVRGDFTWDMVKRANTLGVQVDSRAVRLHPPARADVPIYRTDFGDPVLYDSGDVRPKAVAAGVTIAGLSMLEICLLAGPAFAVGARRSRRQLGLVGANGGDRRHIRAIVLSSGLVLGAAAAVVGTLLGVVATMLLRGTLEGYVGQRFGGLTLRPTELAGVGGLAVLTGLLASVVPAVGAARQSVLASLTGRRGVRRANRFLPVAGLLLLGLGVAVVFCATMLTDSTYSAVLGAALAEAGLVMLTSAIIGAFGRLGRWLPLAPRLALRDAVRNRGRTAPAVAAVLAAVAGSVAVASYAASQAQEDRQAYVARLPHGEVAVGANGEAAGDLAQVRAAVEKNYPVTGRVDVSRVYVGGASCLKDEGLPGCGRIEMRMPPANVCPSSGPTGAHRLTVAQREALVHDWRCALRWGPSAISASDGVLVGGPAVLHALGVRDGAAEQALARGETVLFDRAYADHGSVKFTVIADVTKESQDGTEPAGAVKSLPVHLAAEEEPYGVVAVVPRRAADAAGFTTTPLGSYYTTSQMPSGAQRQALNSDVAKIGTRAEVYLERGYIGHGNLVLVALTLFAGVITIGAAGIATGLAQTDAEPDLRTLAAIGAPGQVRRTLTGFQCGVVAVMGVVLGSAAGVLPAIALRRGDQHRRWDEYRRELDEGWGAVTPPKVPLVVPWATLALLVVVVPLGAGLLAALVTRSRPDLGRRAEG